MTESEAAELIQERDDLAKEVERLWKRRKPPKHPIRLGVLSVLYYSMALVAVMVKVGGDLWLVSQGVEGGLSESVSNVISGVISAFLVAGTTCIQGRVEGRNGHGDEQGKG